MTLPTETHTDMFINGQWTTGSAGTVDVLDPATGKVIATVPRAGRDDVQRAIDAAAAALPIWSATAPRDRAEVLRRAFEIMIARREELAYLMSLEMGKSLTDSRAEVTYAAEFFRWFSEETVRVGGELRLAPSGANRILTFQRPIGVSLLLTPWNFPAAMATRKLAPALAAGCTVVLKPADLTPLTALAVAAVLDEAGAPAGVVNVINTDQPGDAVEWALADRRVRKLSFTGSTRVGSILLKQAADRIVSTSMELGGNAPFVIFDDADLDLAVEGAMLAKMRNGGQACTAANRFLVQEGIVEAFAARLAAAMGALRVGPGTDERTELGPMISERQRDNVATTVRQTIAAGAVATLGGASPDGDGYFYPATVLTQVPRTSPAATEEIFGPVAPIISFTDERDAIELANATEMGLSGYVFTRDLARGLRVCEQLQVGMIGLNRGLVSDPAAPFGGVKESGLGREGGFEGIEEYLETTYVATSWS
jgi:succinate-semialdehyde dehydrogenase/glutarate-semialdehyde dehydrogenase